MKEFLAVISLVISGALCEAQGPYPPSGWRPQGPTLELPERTPVDPRNRVPQKQEYIPPQESTTPSQEYGPPEVDVSVQGLPTEEQLPIFQLSPVNGQQYVGPNFNSDLRNLEQNLRDAQLQSQQNIYREFTRQRQLEAALANVNANRVANPRQFVPRTTTTTTAKPDDVRTTQETTTEALNQGEVEDQKEKVSVEVSKQNIQEYHPELYLASLAQLQLQNQYAPVQLGQLRAPIFLEPTQKVVDSQVLAQQYLQLQQQLVQNQAQLVQAQQIQPAQVGAPTYLVPEQQAQSQPANQYEAVQPVQTYPQQVFLQPQPNQLLPRPQDQQNDEQQTVQPQGQPQYVYQYQPDYQQPNQYQPQQPTLQMQQPNLQVQQQQNQFYQQPLNSYQSEQLPQYYVQDPLYQQQVAQIAQQQIFQQQLAQQQQLIAQQQLAQQQLAQQQLAQQQLAQQQLAQQQGQGSLQSGLDVNQQGNGLDEDKENEGQDDRNTATAVANAFGTRTQPRVNQGYGAPSSVPRVQANTGYNYQQPTTESQEETTEGGPTVAEATAVARGDRRRPAKLRARQGRLRPIFTLDKSGHLVLAQGQ